MARRVKDVTVAADGRDKGKVFRITELPASAAEEWAMRAFLAMARAGVDIPDELLQSGMAGLAAIGVQGALAGLRQLQWSEAKPLVDAMMGCVQTVPNAAQPGVVRPLIEDDVEEVSTRMLLRLEVLSLHVGFSKAVAP